MLLSVWRSRDAPCYCHGTAILTEGGEVRVEELAIGDRVVTVRPDLCAGLTALRLFRREV